mmetsp:Transcript_59172/g.144655  ORF Transcript_59172/g.144655 Transcript_59172/m.144655 type:complete len:196 (-) Transcript_59172:220-807(-)
MLFSVLTVVLCGMSGASVDALDPPNRSIMISKRRDIMSKIYQNRRHNVRHLVNNNNNKDAKRSPHDSRKLFDSTEPLPFGFGTDAGDIATDPNDEDQKPTVKSTSNGDPRLAQMAIQFPLLSRQGRSEILTFETFKVLILTTFCQFCSIGTTVICSRSRSFNQTKSVGTCSHQERILLPPWCRSLVRQFSDNTMP